MVTKVLVFFVVLAATCFIDVISAAPEQNNERNEFIAQLLNAAKSRFPVQSNSTITAQPQADTCNFDSLLIDPMNELFKQCDFSTTLNICLPSNICTCFNLDTILKSPQFVKLLKDNGIEQGVIDQLLDQNVFSTILEEGSCRATKGSFCPAEKLDLPTKEPFLLVLQKTINNIRCAGDLKCAELKDAPDGYALGTCDASFVVSSLLVLATSLLSHFVLLH